MTTETFSYPPLDRATASIRLLSFALQSPDNELLTCELRTWEVDKCPPFIALSYVWGRSASWARGPELPLHGILIGGNKFLVRENLWDAMYVLQTHARQASAITAIRSRGLDGTLCPQRELPALNHFWIDAVCINQEDLVERGHQVNLMKQIYSTAQITVAWLGAEHKDSQLALETLAGYPHGKEGRAALATLCQLEYWGRMWVIQEYVLSKSLFFLWGATGIWWDQTVYMSLNGLSIDSTDGLIMQLKATSVMKHETERTLGSVAMGNTLERLIPKFRYGACSDPRDRVYAILGLVEGQLSFSPDYTISVLQLYYRVLGSLRYSKRFYNTASWEYFRFELRSALEVEQSDNSRLDAALYNVTEGQRLKERQKMGLDVAQNDLWGNGNNTIREETARETLRRFYRKKQAKRDRHPDNVCDYIARIFPPYVPHEDPVAWLLFNRALLEEEERVRGT